MPSAPPVHLITFGRLALVDAEGRDLLPHDVTKPLALLAFLAATPGRRATRERLVDLFWGDSALDQGRSSLRQVLYRLREALGEEAIGSKGPTLHLTADLTTDRDAFLHALDTDELEAALAHYGGPYITDFVSRGTTQFELWRDQEQDRLHDLFSNTIDVVGQRAITEGHTSTAAALAQRVLQDHPLDERGWRLRLQAEQLAGSRIHLTASIAELRRLFAAEGWQPQLRTTQLLDVLERTRAEPAERTGSESLAGDLVGRGGVMANLYHHWREVTRHSGRHLHIVGGAGLGKTRIMDDFAVRLRAERGRVAMAGAHPRQRFVPGSMLATVIAALAELPGASGIATESARILVDLQPTLSTRFPSATPHINGEGHARAAVVGEALHDLLEAVTDDGTICLLLDDAHWWDDESRHLIDAAIERVHDRAILVITASRSGHSEIATELTRERIELARWECADVLALLGSLGASDDAAASELLATALCAAAEGVPLLVLEALRLGLDRSLITLTDRQWTFPGLTEYLTLLKPGQLLRERASTLNDHQRHVLLVSWLFESDITSEDWHAIDATPHDDAAVELERLGFLTSSGRGWKIGHDAIGEAIEAAASSEALKAAHRDAGRLALQDGDHPTVLRRAATHGLEAGDRSVLHEVVVRWVRQRRLAGATAPTARLLSEVFPEGASPATIAQIVRDLPNDLRRRPWSARRLAPVWAIAGAAVVFGGFWLTARRGEPDAVLVLYGEDHDGRLVEALLPLRHSGWGAGTPNFQRPGPLGATSPWRFAARDTLGSQPKGDPTGTRWIFARPTTSPEGPTELVLVATGGEQRLAPAKGDDALPSWSPDGRSAVFQTTRWTADSLPNFDLGIVDVVTGVVRRLTSSDGEELTPHWSPDGTRLAYVKRPARKAPDSLCWISVDGNRGGCSATDESQVADVLGWTDAHTLLMNQRTSGRCAAVMIDIDSRAIRRLPNETGCDAALSPDRTWLVTPPSGESAAANDRLLVITSLTGLGLARTVTIPAALHKVFGSYWRQVARPGSIEKIAVLHQSDTLYAGTTSQLQLSGTDQIGTAVAIPPGLVEWHSSDSTIASVDSSGMALPRRAGAVVITGLAGGWRTVSEPLVVAQAEVHPLLTEAWSIGWERRWQRWGQPLPRLTDGGPGGSPALLVNGDHEYHSGVYSTTPLNASAGIALDVRMSTPLTRSKWQVLKVGFGSIRSVSPAGGIADWGCQISYPSGEGWHALTEVGTLGGVVPVDTSLASGRWYTVRVQLFPDGTCGFALDRRPLSRSVSPLAHRDSAAISLEGQTLGSPLLIGPLKVWSGVPTDIDWGKLQKVPAALRSPR